MGKGTKLFKRTSTGQSNENIFAASDEADSPDEGDLGVNAIREEASQDYDEDSQVLQRRHGGPARQQHAVDVIEDSQEPDEATYHAAETQQAPIKRKRNYHIIPEHLEVSVVEWYRDHEFLYNRKMRAYRDRDRKAKAWEDKAAEINVSGE